jgi:hypothetical protein
MDQPFFQQLRLMFRGMQLVGGFFAEFSGEGFDFIQSGTDPIEGGPVAAGQTVSGGGEYGTEPV